MNTKHLIKTYPLLTVFDHRRSLTRAIQRIDLRNTKPIELADLSYYASCDTVKVYASAEPVNEKTNTKTQTCIKLSPSDLGAIREAIGAKTRRSISEASLANLQTAPAWTADSRPKTPSKYSEKLIQKALALKDAALSWSQLGKILAVNPRGIQSACRGYLPV